MNYTAEDAERDRKTVARLQAKKKQIAAEPWLNRHQEEDFHEWPLSWHVEQLEAELRLKAYEQTLPRLCFRCQKPFPDDGLSVPGLLVGCEVNGEQVPVLLCYVCADEELGPVEHAIEFRGVYGSVGA